MEDYLQNCYFIARVNSSLILWAFQIALVQSFSISSSICLGLFYRNHPKHFWHTSYDNDIFFSNTHVTQFLRLGPFDDESAKKDSTLSGSKRRLQVRRGSVRQTTDLEWTVESMAMPIL